MSGHLEESNTVCLWPGADEWLLNLHAPYAELERRDETGLSSQFNSVGMISPPLSEKYDFDETSERYM